MTEVPTFTASIYCGLQIRYAGQHHSIKTAKRLVREYCDEFKIGATVTKTTFAYPGGSEPGFIVGLTNYPRYPSDPETVRAHALTLAEDLKDELDQDRVTVVFPDKTVMLGSL